MSGSILLYMIGLLVEFDQPQTMTELVYEVEETIRQRTQEVRVEASDDGGRAYRQISGSKI